MSHESERITRRTRIDPKLRAAGWDVIPATSFSSPTGDRLAVEEFETPIGPADYALFDRGRCLGVEEAKKLTLGPQGVLVQAERYSRAIDQTPKHQGEFGAPFLYATNGEVIWFHDVRHTLNRNRPPDLPVDEVRRHMRLVNALCRFVELADRADVRSSR